MGKYLLFLTYPDRISFIFHCVLTSILNVLVVEVFNDSMKASPGICDKILLLVRSNNLQYEGKRVEKIYRDENNRGNVD